jgi:alkyl hydroperoxide reductase subunit AhpF
MLDDPTGVISRSFGVISESTGLALLQVGGHPSKTSIDIIEQIRQLEGEYEFETHISLSCQNCPDVAPARKQPK